MRPRLQLFFQWAGFSRLPCIPPLLRRHRTRARHGEPSMFQRMTQFATTLILGAFAAMTLPSGDAGAAYPDKPIRFVIPSAPGGSPDVIMRLLMNQMSSQMGVPIVID